MISKCKHITSEEERLIERIACDLQTGNHLLRPRDDKYWEIFYEMVRLRTKEIHGHPMTLREQEMSEYETQCSDYFYWKHLPKDKKLFLEEDGDD